MIVRVFSIVCFSFSLLDWCKSECFSRFPTDLSKRYTDIALTCPNTSFIKSMDRNITLKFPILFERSRITLEKAPFVEFTAIFYDIQPMFTIAMPLYNAQNLIQKSLRSVVNTTTSSWSLDIVIDACTDSTRLVVYQSLHRLLRRLKGSLASNCASLCRNYTNSCSKLAFPTRIRVIVAPTPLYECKAENLVYSSNDPSWAYVSVQPDQQLTERGWNLQLALPLQLWGDIVSASASCAHNLFKYKGFNSYLGVGPKCNESYEAPTSLRVAERSTKPAFIVRESSNRGPLIFHAKKLQLMNFLDEKNFLLSNDDHDLHIRAYGQYRWVTGFWPIGWRELVSDKAKDRTLSPATHAAAINVSEEIVRAFMANRDGGVAKMNFRGHKPARRRPGVGGINGTPYREHTRYATQHDIRRVHTRCDEELYSQMAALCRCEDSV